jgi:hypothetical protein
MSRMLFRKSESKSVQFVRSSPRREAERDEWHS